MGRSPVPLARERTRFPRISYTSRHCSRVALPGISSRCMTAATGPPDWSRGTGMPDRSRARSWQSRSSRSGTDRSAHFLTLSESSNAEPFAYPVWAQAYWKPYWHASHSAPSASSCSRSHIVLEWSSVRWPSFEQSRRGRDLLLDGLLDDLHYRWRVLVRILCVIRH